MRGCCLVAPGGRTITRSAILRRRPQEHDVFSQVYLDEHLGVKSLLFGAHALRPEGGGLSRGCPLDESSVDGRRDDPSSLQTHRRFHSPHWVRYERTISPTM